MKVLTLSYYNSFSRFFKRLEIEINKDMSVKFYRFSIYPSSFFYYLINFSKNIFLPLNVRIFSIFHRNLKSWTDFDEMLDYHLSLENKIPKKRFKEICIKYLNYYYFYLKKNNIDLIISSGDSRLYVETLVVAARKLNTQIIFFEQGPYKTTMLDIKGVNANSSFRTKELNEIGDFDELLSFLKKKSLSRNSMKLSSIYRLMKFFDYLVQFSFFGKLFFKELFIQFKSRERLLVKRETVEYNKNNILLILQVPYDIQLVKHSPLIKDFLDMIKKTYELLPSKYNLIVKEHPLHFGKYSKELYDYLELNNIKLLESMSLKESLELVDIVIVNNSIAGLESILGLKKTIVLGNSYYDRESVVIKIKDLEHYSSILLNLDKNVVDERQMKKFCCNLFYDYLFLGHFMDENLDFTSSIASYFKGEFYENHKKY